MDPINIFLPSDSIPKLKISQHINHGSLQEKVIGILTNKDLLVTELSDQEYLMIRDLLLSTGINYKVVINIPEIESNQSFLYEDELDHVISYDSLQLKEKPETDKFMDLLKSRNVEINHQGDKPEEDEEERYDDPSIP